MIRTKAQLRRWIKAQRALHGQLMTMDGFDDCIIGLCERAGSPPYFVYDRALIIRKLVKDGATPEDALEHHSFNQAAAWVGMHTPGFVDRP